MISYIITNYIIRFFGHGSTAKNKERKACLMLLGPASGGAIAAYIDFYSPEFLKTKQDSVTNPSSETPIIRGNMSITEIDSVINMLRNENPIYVHWSNSCNQLWLDTIPEPVGEKES